MRSLGNNATIARLLYLAVVLRGGRRRVLVARSHMNMSRFNAFWLIALALAVAPFAGVTA
jgi:hypothetical protein